MPLSPGDRLGPYEIVAPLGAGGMGEVYRARDTRLKRDVAIKVLPDAFAADPGRLARFTREAEVLASLNHPNIATVFGVEDRALVMELVEGEPPCGPMGFDAAWKIAGQIAVALEYAHERGIVHRDLKPANVLVNQEGLVKLLDFGLAKAFTGETSQTPANQIPANQEHSPTLTMAAVGGVTQMGVVLGTAAYMSPEQAKGKNVDQRADIWAFGVVLYELLTGERLFQRDEIADTLAQVLTREPDLNKVPLRAHRLLRRCLQRDPKERLRDIREARHYIDEPAVAPPPSASRRMRWLPWAAAVALLLAGAAYWRGLAPPIARIHSFILPPEQASFRCLGDDAGPAALSPDGKRLAFTATADSKVQLWVRLLDSPAAQPLAGTEGAQFPFWSADSRWLGFFANEKLKKVEALGGTVSVLADAPVAKGGAWNRDDVIVFAPRATSTLVSVPAAGGVVTPVTRLDETHQEISHRWPSFLPDGKHFLYTSRNKGVFLASLDGKDAPRRLLEESSNAIYDAGYVLYARGNSLLARPFDAGRGEFTGAAATLSQSMAGYTDSDRGCFTVANELLAYHSGLAESRFTWIDRAGNRTAALGESGLFDGLAISPDGTRFATAVADGSGPTTAWIYDLSRGSRTRLSAGTGTMSFAWAADGKRLAIGAARDGAYVLAVANADGSGGEEVLLRSNFEISPTAWMADGGLVVGVRDPATGWDIDYLPAAVIGRDRVPVLHAPGDQLTGALSPNGRWILYLAGDSSGVSGTFIARFPRIGNRQPVSTAAAETMRWNRDGKEIFYSNRSRLMSALVRESGDTLEIGEPRMLFEMRVDCATVFGAGCFDVSPDGKRFLVMEPTDSVPPVALVQNWQAGLKK